MTTALEIITGAARILGVIRKGEALDADEAADGLEAMNGLLSSWSASALFILGRTWESFTLTASAEHAIGSGQSLDTIVPTQIIDAFIRDASIDYPLAIISEEEYRALPLKTTSSNVPAYLVYSRDMGADTGTIRLYPVPSGGQQLHLLSEKKVSEIAEVNDTVFLPHAGWKRALRYNLAIDLAPEYGQPVSQEVYKIAGDSLRQLRLESARNIKLPHQPQARRINNIYTGWAT